MKLKHVMTMITAAALASACTQTPQNLKSGIDLANLDTTALPGTDFYQYATGGWQKANPLTAEYSRMEVSMYCRRTTTSSCVSSLIVLQVWIMLQAASSRR